MQPKVSVIMPVCDVEEYLRICLDSVCGQTLREIEIICIDDKSCDASKEILREYQQRDSRIVILENERKQGAAQSRNKGIKIASGEYLSILDADDYFERDMLEKAYTACKKVNADICAYDFFEFDSVTGKVVRRNNQPFYDCYSEHVRPIEEGEVMQIVDMHDCFRTFYIGGAWQKMYRRDFIVNKGIVFQDLPNANDLYFCAIAMVIAEKLVYIHSPLAHYRINRFGQTIGKISKFPLSLYYAFKLLYSKLCECGYYEKVSLEYNSIVVSILTGIMVQMNEHGALDMLYREIKKDNFQSLGISRIEIEEFLYTRDYWIARALSATDSAEDFIRKLNDEEYMSDRIDVFFEELKSSGYVCALWGYGELGKKWLREAAKRDYQVKEIIDMDVKKQGIRVNDAEVKPYGACAADVEAFIITNSKYRNEILHMIKNDSHKRLLIDYSYYIECNKKIDYCLFR